MKLSAILPVLASCLLLASSVEPAAVDRGCGASDPATVGPGTDAPSSTNATVTTAPSTTAPATTAPSTTAPPSTTTATPSVTEAPTTTAPATTAPATTAPATNAPSTTAPSTTEPATTAPATTAPATTAPATTEPATTAPATTAPATTAPATTAPATTEPATTAPATTEPATTAPATTEPATTAPTTGSGFTRFFDEATFEATFPNQISLYAFQGFVDAVNTYPAFANTGDDTNDKRELAAFLAQTAHECDNYQAAEEYNWATYPESEYCNITLGACTAGQRYHGRGPIQISWNYNYISAGEALDLNLLDNPSLVSTTSSVAWQTALWFWMTPQKAGLIIHDEVIKDGGFATSTDVINGDLECGGTAQSNELQRIENYEKMCDLLGVEPLGKTSCNA